MLQLVSMTGLLSRLHLMHLFQRYLYLSLIQKLNIYVLRNRFISY